MAQITLTIPDEHIQRILDAFAAVHGYDPVNNGTKAQFARAKLRDFVKEIVVRHELSERQRQAVDKLQSEVDGMGIT